jgi:hypothetical protein
LVVVLRVAMRGSLALLLALALPLLAIPLPGRSQAKRVYCRLLLWLWEFGSRCRVGRSAICPVCW